jgi:hypothetical protein
VNEVALNTNQKANILFAKPKLGKVLALELLENLL